MKIQFRYFIAAGVAFATLTGCKPVSESDDGYPKPPKAPITDSVLYPEGPSTFSVYTYHNDNYRSGQNTDEKVLTPANVNPKQFGKIMSLKVDGYVYAQPLYAANVSLPKGAMADFLIVATEHDSVYAFNAKSGAIVWQKSFLVDGATTVPSNDTGTDDLVPEIGITSTPVIDPNSGTIYTVAKTKENGSYFHRLHALKLSTGEELPNSPVEIKGSVTGNGAGSNGGTLKFDPFLQHQRPGLALANNAIYIAFGSHGDNGNFHGWLFAYDATTLNQLGVLATTPNGTDGGIWQAGGAPAIDADGNVYLMTGNGTFNPTNNDYGDSMIRVGFLNHVLSILDYFSPLDQSSLDTNDGDLGSGGVMLLPDQAAGPVHLAVGGGKEGNLYVINRDSMGRFNANSDKIVSGLNVGVSIFSTPAFWAGHIYVVTGNSNLKELNFENDDGLAEQSRSKNHFSFVFGAPVSISANGETNGIAWANDVTDKSGSGSGVLHAYDATDVSKELYNSNMNGSIDHEAGNIKFAVPTIANGRVYIGNQGQVTVYGLK